MPRDASSIKITTLISTGRHPSSGRERRAEQDARAVELAMTFAGPSVDLVHAGNSENSVLKSYAGMGVPVVNALAVNETDDAASALIKYLKANKADVILTGVRAESGESSGMVPYLVAEALGWPLVPRIAGIARIEEGEAELLQALPRGQRRAIKVKLPFIATVDSAAPEPRQSAFGPASRAKIVTHEVQTDTDESASAWQVSPAKKRPKRLKMVKAKTAADRFKAATAKASNEGGKVMKNETPAEQANAIFDLLLEEGVIR